jgi:hypothetical protein
MDQIVRARGVVPGLEREGSQAAKLQVDQVSGARGPNSPTEGAR